MRGGDKNKSTFLAMVPEKEEKVYSMDIHTRVPGHWLWTMDCILFTVGVTLHWNFTEEFLHH